MIRLRRAFASGLFLLNEKLPGLGLENGLGSVLEDEDVDCCTAAGPLCLEKRRSCSFVKYRAGPALLGRLGLTTGSVEMPAFGGAIG